MMLNELYVVSVQNKHGVLVPIVATDNSFSAHRCYGEFRKEQWENSYWDFSVAPLIGPIPFDKSDWGFWGIISFILVVYSPWRPLRRLGAWIFQMELKFRMWRAKRGRR